MTNAPTTQGGTPGRLANTLAALSLVVADAVRSTTESTAELGAAGPAALVTLHEFLDHASIDRLSQALSLSPSGTVRLVDRMVAKGYVERRPGPDARSVSLSLTPSGHRVAGRIQAARAATVGTLVEQLSGDEEEMLLRVTEKLLTAIVGRRLDERARGEPPAGGWLCRLCDPDACGRPSGLCPAANAARAAGSPET